MKEFEILCVTMHQNDFSKIKEMNINTNVVFANQTDKMSYSEHTFNTYQARMISTNTKGVGINRNIALMYADCKYALFSDDDVCYVDNLEEIVVNEFYTHPDADVIIFNIDGDDQSRKQKRYYSTRKVKSWEKKPWGAVRIAVKLDSVRKKNIWYTSLFGGGCKYPSGEDSLWIVDAMRKGLVFYVSKECIGTVSFEDSSWYFGMDPEFYFGKGAYYQMAHPNTKYFWGLYFAIRTRKKSQISFFERILWIDQGMKAFKVGNTFEETSKGNRFT